MPRIVRRLHNPGTRVLDPAAFIPQPDASTFRFSAQLQPRWSNDQRRATIGYSQIDPRAYASAAAAANLEWLARSPIVRWKHDRRRALIRFSEGFVAPWATPGAYYCNAFARPRWECQLFARPVWDCGLRAMPFN